MQARKAFWLELNFSRMFKMLLAIESDNAVEKEKLTLCVTSFLIEINHVNQ